MYHTGCYKICYNGDNRNVDNIEVIEYLLTYQYVNNSLSCIEQSEFSLPIKKISRDEYIQGKTNIFVPAALELSIREKDKHDLQCDIIFEGSNGPISDKAEEILKEKRYLLFLILCVIRAEWL